jgi:hypothetical protein
MKQNHRRAYPLAAVAGALLTFAAGVAAQQPVATKPPTTRVDPAAEMADHAMMAPMDTNNMKHMFLSPTRRATKADSVRALALVRELRAGVAKYRNTTAAVTDGFGWMVHANVFAGDDLGMIFGDHHGAHEH